MYLQCFGHLSFSEVVYFGVEAHSSLTSTTRSYTTWFMVDSLTIIEILNGYYHILIVNIVHAVVRVSGK